MGTMTLINDEQGLFFATDEGALAMARLKSKAFYLLEPGKWMVATIWVESGTEWSLLERFHEILGGH